VRKLVNRLQTESDEQVKVNLEAECAVMSRSHFFHEIEPRWLPMILARQLIQHRHWVLTWLKTDTVYQLHINHGWSERNVSQWCNNNSLSGPEATVIVSCRQLRTDAMNDACKLCTL